MERGDRPASRRSASPERDIQTSRLQPRRRCTTTTSATQRRCSAATRRRTRSASSCARSTGSARCSMRWSRPARPTSVGPDCVDRGRHRARSAGARARRRSTRAAPRRSNIAAAGRLLATCACSRSPRRSRAAADADPMRAVRADAQAAEQRPRSSPGRCGTGVTAHGQVRDDPLATRRRLNGADREHSHLVQCLAPRQTAVMRKLDRLRCCARARLGAASAAACRPAQSHRARPGERARGNAGRAQRLPLREIERRDRAADARARVPRLRVRRRARAPIASSSSSDGQVIWVDVDARTGRILRISR